MGSARNGMEPKLSLARIEDAILIDILLVFFWFGFVFLGGVSWKTKESSYFGK
jgi:hypothetical protein